jgi:hypothetical protein
MLRKEYKKMRGILALGLLVLVVLVVLLRWYYRPTVEFVGKAGPPNGAGR